jgi:pimeloyl-ACP methyl ester carboxylesterase
MGRRAAGDRREPLGRLIRFDATDGVALAGLLFEPPRPNGAILWLHGTGGASVFESARTNMLARVFNQYRLAFFPFNNRGAHYVRRAGRHFGGSAFERIRECVYDIDGAVGELRRRGYKDFTLAGHSTGANKIAVYDHYRKRNRAKRYVLVAGADDAGLLYEELGAKKFRAFLKRAPSLRNTWMPGRMMTWRAFYDMANPNGDYNVFPFHPAIRGRRPFRFIHGISKPTLYIYGELDEFGFDTELLSKHIGARGEIVVIRDADHGFSGKEEELARLIGEWVTAEAVTKTRRRRE